MKNKNYIIKYNTKNLNLQIITLNQSFYIYIGDHQMLFENLFLSIPNLVKKTENKAQNLLPENISCSALINDEMTCGSLKVAVGSIIGSYGIHITACGLSNKEIYVI